MGFVALALVVALYQGQQVSENVVRELIELPTRDRFDNQLLAKSLIGQGEQRAAFIVIESLPNKTAGNLYEWYKRDGDVARMMHEINASYHGPEALPKIIEEAIYYGGVERAQAALAYMEEYGFYSARRNLHDLDKYFHDCSPALQAYVLFATEELAEEATSILPHVETHEIEHHHETLHPLLYNGGPVLLNGFVASYPRFFGPYLLSHRARVYDDEDLRRTALDMFLFGADPGVLRFSPYFPRDVQLSVPMWLVLELYEQGSRATATRLVHKYWQGTVASYVKSGSLRSDTWFFDVLAKNGHEELLLELAQAVLKTAHEELEAGIDIVANRGSSPSNRFKTALSIYVILDMDEEADLLVADYSELYGASETSGFGGESLESFQIGTLTAIGRFEEAVARWFDDGSVVGASNAVRSWIRFLRSAGDDNGARAVMIRYLDWLEDNGENVPQTMAQFGAPSLNQLLRELGMLEELRTIVDRRWSGNADEYSGFGARSAVLGFAMLGDVDRAREFLVAAMEDPYYLGGAPGGRIVGWMIASGRSEHFFERIGGARLIEATMDAVVQEGVGERKYVGFLADGLVSALTYVQGSAQLVEAVVRQIERLLEHTTEERRPRIERELLDAVVRMSLHPTRYQSYPQLPLKLQERVLQAILGARAA